MKILTCFGAALLLVASAVRAAEFAPPDLTIDPPKTAHSKLEKPGAAKPNVLNPPESQWTSGGKGKPAKSFGNISNGPCDECKLSLRARERPLYPNIGPTPLWDPGEPPAPDNDQ